MSNRKWSIKRRLSSAGSEHLPYKQRVTGSNPVASTTERKASRNWCFFAFKGTNWMFFQGGEAGSEHSDLKSEVVTGSNPVASTTERKASNKWSFFAFKEFILQFSLMYTVYIIYSPSLDRYYIGFTQDITDRLRRHNSKSKGFTNRANDWIIVHVESFNQKNEAMRREKEIKGWETHPWW